MSSITPTNTENESDVQTTELDVLDDLPLAEMAVSLDSALDLLIQALDEESR